MKIKHILKAKDFADVIKDGKKVRGRTIALYVQHGDRKEEASFGVVISRGFVPLAVTRNYVKRTIYSYFRDKSSPWERGIKVVVRVVRDLRSLKRKPLATEIRDELEALTEKAGIKA